MSANDRILLDKILEQRRQEESSELPAAQYFELFTAYPRSEFLCQIQQTTPKTTPNVKNLAPRERL